MSKRAKIFTVIGILLVFVSGVSWVAVAQSTEQETPLAREGMGFVLGTIASMAGDSFSVDTESGEIQINSDEQTDYRIIGVQTATVADFAVGDAVRVRGVRQPDRVMLARQVARVPSGDMISGRVALTIDDGLALATLDDQVIDIAMATDSIVVSGPHEAYWSDFERWQWLEGSRVIVFGELNSDETGLTATTLLVTRPQNRRPVLRGEIATIGDQEFGLRIADGNEITIVTTAETRYLDPGDSGAAFGSLESGQQVNIWGHRVGDRHPSFPAAEAHLIVINSNSS